MSKGHKFCLHTGWAGRIEPVGVIEMIEEEMHFDRHRLVKYYSFE